jgi:uncharacterized protein YlzI (FlbEa/FlbD family)
MAKFIKVETDLGTTLLVNADYITIVRPAPDKTGKAIIEMAGGSGMNVNQGLEEIQKKIQADLIIA